MTPKRLLPYLVGAALLVVSCQMPPGTTQTRPGSPPLAISAGPADAAPASAPTTGTYRGIDECQSGPEFELSYRLDDWELRESTLVHRTITACSLELAAHGQQVSGPKQEASKALAGVAWQVSTFPSEGLASYWLETAGGCYLLIARYGARSSASAAHQCQQAAEAVIDSFQLVQ